MKNAMFVLLGVLIFPTMTLAGVLSANYQEGAAYQIIVPQQPTSNKEKIEVVELFWYGCPHCHRFEPFVERWLESKPDYVEYVRLPAIFRENWAIHAQAFYAAEALGVVEEIHKPLFTAIHAHKRKLDSEESLAEFFAENGVDKDEFINAFRSFGVKAKVQHARVMSRRYGITGTPGMVVNGKYRVDGNICNCGFNEIINIVDFLAQKEHETTQ